MGVKRDMQRIRKNLGVAADRRRHYSWYENRFKALLYVLANGLTIPDREYKILKMRIGVDGDSMSLHQVASVYKVTRERIRIIENKAIGRIHEFLTKPEHVGWNRDNESKTESLMKIELSSVKAERDRLRAFIVKAEYIQGSINDAREAIDTAGRNYKYLYDGCMKNGA